jgi:hypothetical protein
MSSKPTYFFYNVYGDAQQLLDTKPNNIIAVPFGWDPATEERRNKILNELQVTVSCLPCVLYWVEQTTQTIIQPIDESNRDGPTEIITQTIPAHWKEHRFEQEEKPWSWTQVTFN